MALHSLSWNTSTRGSEDGLEGIGLLDRRPFVQPEEDDDSEEFIEPLSQDDPFTEQSTTHTHTKHNEIIFINSKRKSNAQNWSGRLRNDKCIGGYVCSAPQMVQSLGTTSYRNGEICTLPTIGHGRSDAILRIDTDTAAALIRGEIKRDYMFIDARFGYEYSGGHVSGAMNVNEEQDICQLLRSEKIIIFYCEFSSVRGPTLARRLRNADRRQNEYPQLCCPEIYVLDGGYNKFHGEYSELCTPNAYIRMHDKRFSEECAREYRKRKHRRQ
ncbi:M-phase inducer phosphatase 3 [Pancytospora epiphaga]|nr:M-phase inducer phosphatase 3 [Pancytospora epiphaga]